MHQEKAIISDIRAIFALFTLSLKMASYFGIAF
jgi:hypothetical protein